MAVAAVSETWLVPGSQFRVSGYACLRDDRNDGYGGCSLLIKRSYSYSHLPLPSHSSPFNVVAVRVMGISFISIYIPYPSSSIIPDLLSVFSSVPSPIFILGDFNAHHTAWGSHSCDSFASDLLDLFEDLNLCVLNDGSPTRRVTPSQDPRSVVDLTACSSSLSSLCTWKTLLQSHGSDHFPIIISKPLSVVPTVSPPPLLKYKTKQADWTKFTTEVELFVGNQTISPLNIDEKLSVLMEALSTAANASIPLKKPNRRNLAPPPWWDSECTDAVTQRKNAETVYNLFMSMENYLNFKQIAARTRRTLAKKKKQGWINFCESLSPRSPSAIVWKNVRRYRGSLAGPSPSSNDPSLWLTDFADKLSPPSVPSQDCIPCPYPIMQNNNRFDQPFSLSELKCALRGLRDSSPGEDGIPYSFLTHLGSAGENFFLDLLNTVFTSGLVPQQWRSQIVIPLLKPGKDPSIASSYRPIALSSTLSKILEHLIKNRLEWIVESKGILSNSQFGFRKSKGTTDSLAVLTTDIRIAFSKEEHLVGVFLDITSAYDNVQLPVLKQKLLRVSIPERLVRCAINLLSDRSISIRSFNHTLPPRKIWQGLPQGSVLSPILFSIYTHDLEQSVSCFCEMLQYADDLCLYTTGKSIDDISSRLNSALYYLNVWLEDHGLSLSIPKCNAVVFSRKRSIPDFDIHCDSQSVPITDKVKFLGVTLDSKMSGVPHFNAVAQKCEKGINILRALSGVWWGSHPYSQKILYNAVVRSHLDYASFLMEPCNKETLGKLEKMQMKGLRIVLGAMKSSAKNVLQVEAVDPPLDLRRQYLSDRFVIKTNQLSSHLLLPRLQILSDMISQPSCKYWAHKNPPLPIISFRKLPSLTYPMLQFPLNPLFQIPYDALIFEPKIILNLDIAKKDPLANQKFKMQIEKDWQHWLPIYTDASKTSEDSPVGSAVWIPKHQVLLSFKSPRESSVFSGECIAILEAVSYVLSHKLSKSVILSDSKSGLNALSSNLFRSKSVSPLILNIKKQLFLCHEENIEVALIWIPGHSGISGNEQVDVWARDAIQRGIGLQHVFAHDILPHATKTLNSDWQSRYVESSQCKGRQYAGIQPIIPRRPWFFNQKTMDRQTISTICRLRIGHSCTPVFLHKIHAKDTSLCECGLDEGTPDHIFFNCPRYPVSLYDILPSKTPRPINLLFLLSFPHPSILNYLCKFIQSNNIRL